MNDIFSVHEIIKRLKSQLIGSHIYTFDEIDSTNSTAKEMAGDNASSGSVILADCQTYGRGRKGRKWASPRGVGIYLSVILKPENSCTNPFLFTIISGIATALAISKTTGLSASIKWPNDIMIGDKKVAGILVETSCYSGKTKFVVIGIGINVNTTIDHIPHDLRDIATSIKIASGKDISRCDLIIDLCCELEKWYNMYIHCELETIKDQWMKISATIGKYVKIDTGAGIISGTAVSISNNGFLMLKSAKGEIKEIVGGEEVL